MNDNKNLTKEEIKELPFIECERMDVSEAKTNDGEKYYRFSFLYEYNGNTSLIKTYTKERAVYEQLLEMPKLCKFKLHYKVGVDRENKLYFIPDAVSL